MDLHEQMKYGEFPSYEQIRDGIMKLIDEGKISREDAALVIPELKESEDERIRKLLVWQVYRNIEDETNDLAQSVYDGIKGHDPDLEESIEDWKKCLAWLEKQKENPQNTDSIPSNCASDAKCDDRHNKPGDFVFKLRQIISRHWWADEHSDRIEDEEGMAKEILELCEKQKEQQPAEWSEEDEKMLNLTKTQLRILQSHLSHTHSERMTDMEYSSKLLQIEKCVSWLDIRLKSLRPQPHWKPSEEQIDALEYSLGNGGKYDKAALKSLYNDLKKL